MAGARWSARGWAALLLLVLVTACANSGEKPDPGPSLPPGTTLGEWGESLKLSEAAPLLLANQAGGTAGAVVSLTAVKAGAGKHQDLRMFSGLPGDTTPWYVSVKTQNRGPDDLDLDEERGWFLRVDDDLLLPPTRVSGKFSDCSGQVPSGVLKAGDERADCLVFLIPASEEPESVDFLRHDGAETVSWTIKKRAEDS